MCVCECCDFVPATCPRYMTLMPVASVCTTHTTFCRWNMSLQYDPLYLPTFTLSLGLLFIMIMKKKFDLVFLRTARMNQ